MSNRETIVIGGSAGSFQAVKDIVRTLPADLPAAVFVVIHLSPRSRNYLPELLQTSTSMLVTQASEGSPIRKGTIYVTPPDRHLVISEDHVHLSRGPKEGLQRPSINVAFRSAAASHGNRVIGVLLSGMLDDGAAGIWEIGRRDGVTIVQDPAEAQFPSMPLNALSDAIVHHTKRVSEIGPLLSRLVREEIVSSIHSRELPLRDMRRFSGFTCPECRGPLYENDKPSEFRCRVGHTMSLKTLFDEHTSVQEKKLYEAIVALEEGAELAERMAVGKHGIEQDELRKEADQLRRGAEFIRRLVEKRDMPAAD
ncbi:MAG TPA: chemotaxis protein CheB [Bryobacteraceae bacterium]|nr:chemotaxis protein CheB [Bryobacteraceae bacterium]